MSEAEIKTIKRKAFKGKVPEIKMKVPKGRWGPGIPLKKSEQL
jgi:hypothetical protein